MKGATRYITRTGFTGTGEAHNPLVQWCTGATTKRPLDGCELNYGVVGGAYAGLITALAYDKSPLVEPQSLV